MQKKVADRIFGVGYLLLASAAFLRHSYMPDKTPHGHWFWIATLGIVMAVSGMLFRILLRKTTA